MRRSFVLVSVLALLLSGSVAGGRLAAVAQEGTPAAEPIVGVTAGLLGAGQPDAAPGHELAMRRLVFEPGGSIADHHHPGALVLYVETGALTYAVVEGVAEVQRPGQDGNPGPTEQLRPGEETVLDAGSSLFEQDVVHSARNAGDEPLVLLLANLHTEGEPLLTMMATPTP